MRLLTMKLKNSSIVASCRRHSHVQSRVSRVQRGCLGLKRVGQVCSCLRILQAAKAICQLCNQKTSSDRACRCTSPGRTRGC